MFMFNKKNVPSNTLDRAYQLDLGVEELSILLYLEHSLGLQYLVYGLNYKLTSGEMLCPAWILIHCYLDRSENNCFFTKGELASIFIFSKVTKPYGTATVRYATGIKK